MKNLIWCIPFFLMACGGVVTPAENENIGFEGQDTIVDFEMNSERLSAVEFNDELSFMQEVTINQIFDLFNSDSANIDLNYENTLFELDMHLQSLNEKKVPKQGEAYLTAMINLMNFYIEDLKNNFPAMIELIKKPVRKKIDTKKLEDYDMNFALKEKELFDSVVAAQDAFAKANNIKLM